MNKNRFFPFTLLSILLLSACGGVSDTVVKPVEIIRGTTNNETLNSYRSFELGEAILLFMPDKKTESVGWDFRSDASIVWATSGYETRKISKNEEFSFREGLLRINVLGVQSKILRKTKEELPWVVTYGTYSNAKFGVETVELEAGDLTEPCFGGLYENCAFNPEPSMAANQIAVTKICQKTLGNTSTIGYELTHPNKKNVFAIFENGAGSGGVSSSFKLVFSKDKKDLCNDGEESSTTDSKPVETIIPTEKEPTSSEEQYLFGLQQKEDEKKIFWMNKAAENGHLEAQSTLSYFYRAGISTTKDEVKGFYWTKKAAEQNDTFSQCVLSGLYDTGTGTKKDNVQTVYWAKKSVDGKWNMNDEHDKSMLSMCQYRLGGAYEYGEGINKDILKAIYWYNKASNLGDDLAKKSLVRLKSVSKNTTEKSSSEIVSQIISRCKKDMGQYGAAMVKGCVDQDVKAVADIVPLLKTYPLASQRCLNDMGQYGYAMVKGCITQDINAEEALKRY